MHGDVLWTHTHSKVTQTTATTTSTQQPPKQPPHYQPTNLPTYPTTPTYTTTPPQQTQQPPQHGAHPKRRRLVHAVRDQAFLPGPPCMKDSEWVIVPASALCAEDIAQWPYTPGFLVKWVSFSGSLHWPAGGLECSSFMICGLVRGCLWRRLFLATFDQDVQFQCRLFRLQQH